MNENLYFHEIGQGPPLICLHAYALDHTIWLKMAEEMRNSVKLILPDLRGHGRSPAPEGKYSMRTMAEDVIRLIDAFKIEQAWFAGHSMGGYITLALAEFFPERFLGLALVASHAFADFPDKKKSRLEEIKKIERLPVPEVLSGMPNKLTKDPAVADYCRQLISQTSRNGVMGVLAGMAERPDRIDVLAELKRPKMLIAGEEDQLIPMKTDLDMVEKVSDLRLVKIKNAGHMPMMENPHDTATALLSLIKNEEGK